MANPLTEGLYVDFLKEWYKGTVVADLCYKNHPLLGLVPKNENVRGEVYPKPVQYANIAGRSNLYQAAHDNQNPAQRDRWENKHIENYAKATVTNKVMALSQGNDAAFREALTSAFDSAYSAFANDQHFELFGDGTGVRGVVTGAPAGDVLQLASGEGRFFEVGMQVEIRDTTGATDRGTTEVVAVDRNGDTITVTTGDVAALSIVSTDLVIQDGDYGIKANGVEAWLVTGSSPGTFLGVPRNVDPVRLAGVDGITGTATDVEVTDSLVKSGARLYREGGMASVAILHPEDVATLAQEVEQRGRYSKVASTKGSVSFSALEIMTGGGAISVVADPAQKPNRAYLLDLGTWELFSAGQAPSMFDKDGSRLHRVEQADQVAFYLYGYYNLLCTNPGGNCKIATLV